MVFNDSVSSLKRSFLKCAKMRFASPKTPLRPASPDVVQRYGTNAAQSNPRALSSDIAKRNHHSMACHRSCVLNSNMEPGAPTAESYPGSETVARGSFARAESGKCLGGIGSYVTIRFTAGIPLISDTKPIKSTGSDTCFKQTFRPSGFQLIIPPELSMRKTR